MVFQSPNHSVAKLGTEELGLELGDNNIRTGSTGIRASWNPNLQPEQDNYCFWNQKRHRSSGCLSLTTKPNKQWQWLNLFFFMVKISTLKIYIFIDYAITVVPFPPLHSILPTPPPTFPPYSSCPWVIHISSLASTFPILFLPSPCVFCTYHLCYLFSVPFPPLSPSHSPVDNPLCDLHFCDSFLF